MDFGVVGDVHHSHHRDDRVAAHAAGNTVAVPPFEGLRQRRLDRVGQVDAFGDIGGGAAVGEERVHRVAHAASEEAAGHRDPSQPGRAFGEMPEQERHHRQPGLVDVVAVGPDPWVVAEPSRHLGGIRDTADPGQ